MSDVITYTKEEQVTLNQLANNERILQNIHLLLQEGSHPGKKATFLIEAFNFVENLLKQTADKKTFVAATAKEREIKEAKAAAEKAKEATAPETTKEETKTPISVVKS